MAEKEHLRAASPHFPKTNAIIPVFSFATNDIRHLMKAAKWPKNKWRIENMATSTTFGFPVPASAPATRDVGVRAGRRRRITPQAGRALEILGHAVEYLTDEFVHEGKSLSADNAQIQAIQLLMAFNRQVYFECPEIPM